MHVSLFAKIRLVNNTQKLTRAFSGKTGCRDQKKFLPIREPPSAFVGARSPHSSNSAAVQLIPSASRKDHLPPL